MIPRHNQDGLLPQGIHQANWEEIVNSFAGTPHRRQMLEGMYKILIELKKAGCRQVFINGSFVTTKKLPGDFDGCWDPTGVNPDHLDPVLLDFSNKRKAMKEKYGGEMFISNGKANLEGDTFLEFFQIDKETGKPKGILLINLERFEDD